MRFANLSLVVAVLIVNAVSPAQEPAPAPPPADVPAPTPERDPILGAPLPQNVVYETKNSWKFEDDALIFVNDNRNTDGKRYLVWKDYHWIITDNEFTILDPRPFGTSLTSSRHGSDKKGRPLTDKKIMDDMKDQAGSLRRAREPVAPPPPVGIGIGFGFGFGSGHHGGHWHGR